MLREGLGLCPSEYALVYASHPTEGSKIKLIFLILGQGKYLCPSAGAMTEAQ